MNEEKKLWLDRQINGDTTKKKCVCEREREHAHA
jgi:hypothetical protein